MKPNVSIVVPVYNTKQYLQQAIDSLLVQKEFIKEIIIVNDGSTDGSGELLDKLYGTNQLIKLLHTENNGQGYARNLGTSNSTGDYIYYFDSDDIVEPNLFKKFNDILEENPTLELFCFSGQSFLDKDTSTNDIVNKGLLSDSSYKRKIDAICSSGEKAFELLYNKKSFFPVPYLYLLKKTILTANKIKYRKIRYEDEEFTQKIFLHAGKTIISNKVYCKRRVREGSVMQLNRNFNDLLGYIKTIESFSEMKNLVQLKSVTKELLWKRIITFVKIIIIIKTSNKIKLNRGQKKIYRQGLNQYIFNDINLFLFNYIYPIEYKLRKLKQRYFNSSKFT